MPLTTYSLPKLALQYINENHENYIYLPGIDLGENVVADSDLLRAVSG